MTDEVTSNLSLQGIRRKLESAQAEDKPRWGDYDDKLDLNYIDKLVKTGRWFDNVRRCSFDNLL